MAHVSADAERWVPAFGFEGLYEVSECGRIRSILRLVNPAHCSPYCVQPRILSPHRSKSGYEHVVLRKDGQSITRTIHRLVLESFVGPRPSGMECCHNNGIRFDNRLTNLRWDTPRSNQEDRAKHGTGNQGFRNPRAFLTADQIIAIRCSSGTCKSVASLHGVSAETVRRIRNGIRWQAVTGG